jgi:hypothetical protein
MNLLKLYLISVSLFAILGNVQAQDSKVEKRTLVHVIGPAMPKKDIQVKDGDMIQFTPFAHPEYLNAKLDISYKYLKGECQCGLEEIGISLSSKRIEGKFTRSAFLYVHGPGEGEIRVTIELTDKENKVLGKRVYYVNIRR